MSEHRRESRLRTFLKGRIIFNKGASTMDCLVRDLSASGARLALTETSTLPESFDLYIPQKDRTYRATLCWRRADGIGITFVDEAAPAPVPVSVPAAAPPPADEAAAMLALVRRISELEAENAALRRLLASPPVSGAA
ncbi:pilus assembly protein PilZ [Methylobacterium sp. Leaf111]|uniref:PilZ domain-containing protein n=1 Tax=unclassified Methylobacterium TaxID=2615210 RepID=UPI0006FC15DA|nr:MULTISPECIES: PilZ domain-containing protein [unclassified Methylobacterium]KQO72450.1 pilus assembly protein PilZ [Methylobacterium sp. Leaf89]KQP74691.1 pilus assembly protein PilZ [Methylobacterium sp. Leaf111]KQU27872.1 pilus assembly protein PilZ [Methylobacterium sp. Leaf94]